MRRYYACKVIDFTMPSGEVIRTPKLDTIPLPEGTSAAFTSLPNVNWALVCLTNPTRDLPKFNDPEIYELPVGGELFDIKLQSIQNNTRAQMLNKLAAFGIDTADLGNSEAVRDLIRKVGLQLDPNFHEDRFGVVG